MSDTRRQRLDAAIKKRMPKVRLDSELTDRQAALQLLAAMRVDADATLSLAGVPLSKESDAYVTEYALAKSGDVRPESDEEAAQLERVRNYKWTKERARG